jgi:hypothetical protein
VILLNPAVVMLKRSQRPGEVEVSGGSGVQSAKFSVVPAGLNLFLNQIPQLKLRAIIGRRFATAKNASR